MWVPGGMNEAGDLGLQRASELLSFPQAPTIADWDDIFVEGKMVCADHSTVLAPAQRRPCAGLCAAYAERWHQEH